MNTPSPSLPITLSPPSAGERLARIASTKTLIDAVTAALPSPSLPPLPPSLHIPPPVDHRDDIPESEQPPHNRLRLSTLGSRYEIRESSTARPTRGQGTDYRFVSMVDAEERRQGVRDVRYGIRDTWVDPAGAVPEIASVTLGEVSTRVVELAEVHEHDIQDVYALLEDAQDGDSIDGGGGGLCFPRGLGSFDRIESGHPLGASDPPQIMAPITRHGQNTPTDNTNPNNMTPEAVQAMIDQALLRNSTNGDGSHSSHGDNRRNVTTPTS
ncbi:hypothetical protein Tco_1455456 [Tanacetum coccineum]